MLAEDTGPNGCKPLEEQSVPFSPSNHNDVDNVKQTQIKRSSTLSTHVALTSTFKLDLALLRRPFNPDRPRIGLCTVYIDEE